MPRSAGSGSKVSPEQLRVFWERRDAGFSVTASARAANFTPRTGWKYDKLEKHLHAEAIANAGAPEAPAPKARHELSAEAKRALTTFAYFQRRYLGRVAIPWQAEAAEQVVKALESPDKEYIVLNAPPGSGKSVTFTCDIPAWVTCRNRAVRGQIGSYTLRQAKWYVGRLRRELERTIPWRATPAKAAAGIECDAESTMALDFGRFKPLDRDMWNSDQFIAMQTTGIAIAEKEPTWSAFGHDSAFMGGRYDFVVWDDLVDPKKVRSPEMRDELRLWYFDVAESRLEPAGLMLLQGQRLGPDDLYHSAMEQKTADFDETGDPIEGSEAPQYHHIVFKAHYETRCKGDKSHKLSSDPYPKGCLLYPRRLTWREIAGLMQNRSDRFSVMYQQEDTDPTEVLVNPDWIWGRGEHPGCIDRDRDRLDIPQGVSGISVVTCDPSPTNNWAIAWWLYEPTTQFRYLIDLYRGKMEAPQLLDFDLRNSAYTGLMPEWQATSMRLGAPITHWVVEINAAQRFLLQYEHVKRWQSLTRVAIVPHTTGRNKSDPDYGVQTIAPHFRFGRVRLPGRGAGMARSQWLIDEVTRYPYGRTDDIVMACWFLDWNIPNLGIRRGRNAPAWRPSWLRR